MGTKGQKYDENLDTAEIAKRIRADIKELIVSGALPKVRVSVRTRRFSGGSAIDLEVTSVPEGFAVYESCEARAGQWDGRKLTDAAQSVITALKGLHEAYNYNNSDAMTDYFDVNYYGSVQYDWAFANAFNNTQKVAS